MTTHYRDKSNYEDLTLVVVLDAPLSKDHTSVKSALAHLKKRFSLNLSFAISNLNILKSYESVLLEKDSFLDTAFVSGSASTLPLDTFSFLKRCSTSHVLIINATQLFEQFLESIRFLNESLYDNRNVTDSSALEAMFFSVNYVRRKSFSELKDISQVFSDKRVTESNSASPDFEAAQTETLFVTMAGVTRFGGLDRMRSFNNLKLGGAGVSEYKTVALLDNCQSIVNERDSGFSDVVQLPTIIHQNDSVLMFDINPVTTIGRACDDTLHVPRTVLSIRKHSHSDNSSFNTINQKEAVFIMSNFNKVKYVVSALYSAVMQTHYQLKVELVDDASDDSSVELVKRFKALLIDPEFVVLTRNANSMGTYWIRNSIIQKYINSSAVYFISDSDDFSSALRITVQMLSLFEQKEFSNVIVFADIVRMNENYEILALDGEVEKYGTASLCCETATHKEAGYYENIKKNADTEFIERVKKFFKTRRTMWLRYPTLFQTFDGNNLTSDIYEISEQRRLDNSNHNRAAHIAAYKEKHQRLSHDALASYYRFPCSSIDKLYASKLKEYVIEGYQNLDCIFLVIDRNMYFKERKLWFDIFDYILVHNVTERSAVIYDAQDNQAAYDIPVAQAIQHFIEQKNCRAFIYNQGATSTNNVIEVQAFINLQITALKRDCIKTGHKHSKGFVPEMIDLKSLTNPLIN
ncbi:MAG: hypothetical protein Alis3KO_25780 [Aliiglaciecola sp.]